MAVRTNSRYRSVVAMIATAMVATGCIDESDDDDAAAAAVPDPGSDPATNNPPSITGTPPAEVDTGETFVFQPQASDPDNDPLFFSVTNKPRWASFDTSTGQLAGRPGELDVGAVDNLSIYVSDGKTSRGLGPFRIEVRRAAGGNPNSAPVIAGTPPATVESGSAYRFQPTASDADNDTLSFSVANRPTWMQLDPNTGLLSGTPSDANAGTYTRIRMSVSDGQAVATLPEFSVTVTVPSAQNRAPSISGSPATAIVAGTAYSFQPAATDPDGDRLTFSVANRPGWLTLDSGSGRLSGTPSVANVGTYNGIVVSVSDGQASASLSAFSIVVTEPDAPNTAPVIGGTPATTAEVGTAYSFTPNASDADNDNLTFSIANRPSWLSFNRNTGRLNGTPAAADVGTHGGIVISVSDGEDTVALPAFAITVAEADNGNTAPTISGTPDSEVMVDSAYTFTPAASDSDNDALTFSISGRPSWLSFDTTTGRLSGTPSAGDIGTYDGIVISVSDGTDSAALPAFAISVLAAATGSVTVSWDAPTENSDGSPLTDLAGYKLHYGTSSGNYTTTIDLNDAGLTTYVIDNLAAGTYFIAATSINSAGVESLYSAEVTKRVTTN